MSAPHYQRLPSVEDEQVDAYAHHVSPPNAPVVEVDDVQQVSSAPSYVEEAPSYDSLAANSLPQPSSQEITLAAAPPSYTSSSSIAPSFDDAKLPTYDDYEKEHENEDTIADLNLPEPYIMPADYTTVREGVPTVTVVEGYEFALGDDPTFVATFFISFFLNWMGFLLTYVFSRTIAGKCGATSGFGLGLIKIAFYIRTTGMDQPEHGGSHGKHSEADDDKYLAWFVWLLILFGWFTFVRGITLYFKYKRQFAIMQGDASTV